MGVLADQPANDTQELQGRPSRLGGLSLRGAVLTPIRRAGQSVVMCLRTLRDTRVPMTVSPISYFGSVLHVGNQSSSGEPSSGVLDFSYSRGCSSLGHARRRVPDRCGDLVVKEATVFARDVGGSATCTSSATSERLPLRMCPPRAAFGPADAGGDGLQRRRPRSSNGQVGIEGRWRSGSLASISQRTGGPPGPAPWFLPRAGPQHRARRIGAAPGPPSGYARPATPVLPAAAERVRKIRAAPAGRVGGCTRFRRAWGCRGPRPAW